MFLFIVSKSSETTHERYFPTTFIESFLEEDLDLLLLSIDHSVKQSSTKKYAEEIENVELLIFNFFVSI